MTTKELPPLPEHHITVRSEEDTSLYRAVGIDPIIDPSTFNGLDLGDEELQNINDAHERMEQNCPLPALEMKICVSTIEEAQLYREAGFIVEIIEDLNS